MQLLRAIQMLCQLFAAVCTLVWRVISKSIWPVERRELRSKQLVEALFCLSERPKSTLLAPLQERWYACTEAVSDQ